MLEEVSSFRDLEITAYHEAGHAIVARLLGIPINLIVLRYRKKFEKWEGEHNGDYDYDPSFIPDYFWNNLNHDSKIPYDKFQFDYSICPEPYEDYKNVRDRCTIDYAGLVTQKLFYKKAGQEDSLMVSEGCFNDLDRAKKRLEGKFQGQDVQEELAYAQSHAEMILNNKIVWKMLKDLAE